MRAAEEVVPLVLGGSLVFDYQFNVESISGSTVWDETETDQFPGKKAKPSG